MDILKAVEIYQNRIFGMINSLMLFCYLSPWKQAFSQDLKSGLPKCAIGPAQIKHL